MLIVSDSSTTSQGYESEILRLLYLLWRFPRARSSPFPSWTRTWAIIIFCPCVIWKGSPTAPTSSSCEIVVSDTNPWNLDTLWYFDVCLRTRTLAQVVHVLGTVLSQFQMLVEILTWPKISLHLYKIYLKKLGMLGWHAQIPRLLHSKPPNNMITTTMFQ